MTAFRRFFAWAAAVAVCSCLESVQAAADPDPMNHPATSVDWQTLSRLPDWSGIWVPVITDQVAQKKTNRPSWRPQIAATIAHMYAEEHDGRPFPVIDHCFPHGMPSWMLITHNAFEILLTPGRVTLLGEGDGNRLRRIYTDGRPHPQDPDPSFHGHSIGHWEKGTLVVDTVAVLPEVPLAVNEAVGVPNDGDMHIVERLHLISPDILADAMEITARKVLSAPWKTTRKYHRERSQKFDILEGVCTQGSFVEEVDPAGHAIFKPIQFHNGVPVGSDSK